MVAAAFFYRHPSTIIFSGNSFAPNISHSLSDSLSLATLSLSLALAVSLVGMPSFRWIHEFYIQIYIFQCVRVLVFMWWEIRIRIQCIMPIERVFNVAFDA